MIKALAYLLVIAVVAVAVALEAWVPFHPVATFVIVAGIVTIGFLRKKVVQ